MANRDTQTEIMEMFSRILGARDDDVGPETPLSKENNIEHIDVVKLVMDCEKRFRVTIWDEDVLQLKSVTDLAAYVDRQLAEGTDDLALHDDKQRNAWYYEY
ncbi:MAG: phosphopantetheine-binding protein [Clostridiales bacterium]|nr:phosphopantetheine-binding protein [Clostridiales bacterium]